MAPRLRRAIGFIALLLSLALLGAACGGGDDDSSDGGGAKEAGQADSKDVQTGGTLTYALEAETSGGICPVEAQLSP